MSKDATDHTLPIAERKQGLAARSANRSAVNNGEGTSGVLAEAGRAGGKRARLLRAYQHTTSHEQCKISTHKAESAPSRKEGNGRDEPSTKGTHNT